MGGGGGGELVCMDLELHQRMAAGGPCQCVYVCCVCELCVRGCVDVVNNVNVHMCVW